MLDAIIVIGAFILAPILGAALVGFLTWLEG